MGRQPQHRPEAEIYLDAPVQTLPQPCRPKNTQACKICRARTHVPHTPGCSSANALVTLCRLLFSGSSCQPQSDTLIHLLGKTCGPGNEELAQESTGARGGGHFPSCSKQPVHALWCICSFIFSFGSSCAQYFPRGGRGPCPGNSQPHRLWLFSCQRVLGRVSGFYSIRAPFLDSAVFLLSSSMSCFSTVLPWALGTIPMHFLSRASWPM